jgi:nitrile hydratase
MNGVHDMGGMHGFGSVPEDDAIFHADWERRTYALNRLLLLAGVYNAHESRHATERMDPARYLTLEYFQRWLESKTALAMENGVFSRAELDRRTAQIAAGEYAADSAAPPADAEPLTGADARAAIRTGVTDREAESASADREPPARRAEFEPGQQVTVRNAHPPGHTRCPRYARGATGTVQSVQGVFELPDASAHGEQRTEPCYAVGFSLRELWGPDGAADDHLTLDLWESYLTA